MHAPSEMTPESRVRSKGRLAFCGSELRVELKPLTIKLANECGVSGASVPPAIAISASPARIIAAASATASRPDGHAEETVEELAAVPMRSAMTFAAAWGAEADSD